MELVTLKSIKLHKYLIKYYAPILKVLSNIANTQATEKAKSIGVLRAFRHPLIP